MRIKDATRNSCLWDKSLSVKGRTINDAFGAGNRGLRRRLLLLDATALVAAWGTLLLSAASDGMLRNAAVVSIAALSSLALLGGHRLYRARMCAIRSLEVLRLGRVAVLAAVAAVVARQTLDAGVAPRTIALHAGLAFVLLVAARGLFRSWLHAERAGGQHVRDVAIVGMNADAIALMGLLRDDPDLGYRVAGVFCHPDEVPEDCPVPWLGPPDDITTRLECAGINGVLLVVTALAPDVRKALLGSLLRAGVHVQVSVGLERVDTRRLRAVPVAHEPTFYVEPAEPAAWQVGSKRLFDVAVGSCALIVTLPILFAAALAILVSDGRPIFYRQARVGRNRRPFQVLKLRTMRTDAERQLHLLRDQNERTGPLFKITEDPRVTKVGRLLRATSIDELPQLWNVLRGEMSLVGPRPPLPSEADEFDDELLERFSVRPGITGLWQVEARDNPSFRLYRHLDLFYVENWSLGFDLAIMLATVEMIIRTLVSRVPTKPVTDQPAADEWRRAIPTEQLRPVETASTAAV